MDRRDFCRLLAGSGALVATSSLPSFSKDKPEVFPQRGGFERLSIAYGTIKIGLPEPFCVFHISDTHLTAANDNEIDTKKQLCEIRTKTFGGRQEEALKDSLAWAKEHVDYVVHTGDLIDFQSEANYEIARKYFGKEIIGSVGNHEFSPEMWLSEVKETRDEAYKNLTRNQVQAAYPFDITFQSQIAKGVNFITLDDVYGYVTAEQVKKFKAEVKKGLPIVLCMHVPFYTDELWRVNFRFWNEKGPYRDAAMPKPTGDYLAQIEDPVTRDFIAYLKTEPLLKAILSGHDHITFEERFSDTAMQYVIAGNFSFTGREILFY